MTPVRIRFFLVPESHRCILGMGGVSRMQHKAPIYASAAISATRGDYQSRGQMARPAVHIYCVDMLAARLLS